MNIDLRRIYALATSRPRKCILVNYDDLFGDNGNMVLTTLLRRLGLAPHPNVSRYLQQNLETYNSLRSKPLNLDDSQKDFIQVSVDWALMAKIRDLSLNSAEESLR
jgi:hypothetical protein